MKYAAMMILPVLVACKPVEQEMKWEIDDTELNMAAASMNAAQKAYFKVNAKMHKGMSKIPADADEAFMVGMIPHHQGAVEMAEIVLKHGKDAETRALAEAIIKAQKTEIAQMQAWLKKRGIDPDAMQDAGAGHSDMEH